MSTLTSILSWFSSSRPSESGSSDKWARGFSLNIVGESRHQGEIKRCRAGELVFLVREPDNPYDDMAVAVVSARGKRLGHLSRDRARWIGGKMDAGVPVKATIDAITGDTKRGVLLKVRLG